MKPQARFPDQSASAVLSSWTGTVSSSLNAQPPGLLQPGSLELAPAQHKVAKRGWDSPTLKVGLCGVPVNGLLSEASTLRSRSGSRQHWSGLPFPSPMHETEK